MRSGLDHEYDPALIEINPHPATYKGVDAGFSSYTVIENAEPG